MASKAASRQEKQHETMRPDATCRSCRASPPETYLGRGFYWQDLNRLSIAVRPRAGREAGLSKAAGPG
jgi:hypothetical protein